MFKSKSVRKAIFSLSTLAYLGAASSAWCVPDVLIMLDSSGSMRAKMQSTTKIEAARRAVDAALRELPEGTFAALRLYGHRVPQTDKEKSCLDSELVIPFGSVDVNQFEAAIKHADPLGYTPISYSLEQSRHDFPVEREANKVIILVSDGEETCGGDPKATIEKLIAEGFKVTVHTVGFDVNTQAEKELRGVADASGGEYFSARNANDLAKVLKEAAQKALIVSKSKTIYGAPIRGGDDFEHAVSIQFGVEQRLDHHQKRDDFDYFSFEGKLGDRITLTSKTIEKGIGFGGSGKPIENRAPEMQVALHKSDRTKLGSVSVFGQYKTETRTFTLPEDGTYFLLVGGATIHSEGGTFQIDKVTLGDGGGNVDAGSEIDTALAISVGRHANNFFMSDEDIDMYAFDVKQGEQYFVGVIPESRSNASIVVRVIDEYGTEVMVDSINRSGKSKNFTLPSDGRYYLFLKSCCWSGDPIRYTFDIKQVQGE